MKNIVKKAKECASLGGTAGECVILAKAVIDMSEALEQIAKGPGMQTPGVTQSDVARAVLKKWSVE